MMMNKQIPPIPARPALRLAAALLLLGLVTACGNKGALYLEGHARSEVAPAEVTDQAAQGRDPDEQEQDESDVTVSASGG